MANFVKVFVKVSSGHEEI